MLCMLMTMQAQRVFTTLHDMHQQIEEAEQDGLERLSSLFVGFLAIADINVENALLEEPLDEASDRDNDKASRRSSRRNRRRRRDQRDNDNRRRIRDRKIIRRGRRTENEES